MKQLFLCRHAKSSWKDTSRGDFKRPLNKRGKCDAPVMGKRLFQAGVRPELLLSSSATRARQTARRLAKELDFPREEIVLLEELYGASVAGLLACIRRVDADPDQLALVGHNPGITLCANVLAGLDIFNVPTCGVVAIEFKITSWRDIQEGEGELIFFDYPKRTEQD